MWENEDEKVWLIYGLSLMLNEIEVLSWNVLIFVLVLFDNKKGVKVYFF